MFLRAKKHKVIIMNWKSVTIIVAFSLLSFTLSLIHSIFAYLSIIPLSIFILDESSDAFFEEVYDSLNPTMRYALSITLLAFIVSLDEIIVSISSIITGYAEISAGALMGSDAITVLMVVLILMAVRRKLDYRKTIPYVIFPAFLIGAGILSEYLNLPPSQTPHKQISHKFNLFKYLCSSQKFYILTLYKLFCLTLNNIILIYKK